MIVSRDLPESQGSPFSSCLMQIPGSRFIHRQIRHGLEKRRYFEYPSYKSEEYSPCPNLDALSDPPPVMVIAFYIVHLIDDNTWRTIE